MVSFFILPFQEDIIYSLKDMDEGVDWSVVQSDDSFELT